jgi:uncharacterized membrane protein (DUF373 family)
MVLIGIELLESLKVYITEDKIHVEVILSIALIAVARKVISLELTTYPSLTIIAISSLVMTLSAGYFLIKKAHQRAKGKQLKDGPKLS